MVAISYSLLKANTFSCWRRTSNRLSSNKVLAGALLPTTLFSKPVFFEARFFSRPDLFPGRVYFPSGFCSARASARSAPKCASSCLSEGAAADSMLDE